MSAQQMTGKIPFIVGNETFETWYEVIGDLSNCPYGPVIALHGGPGFSHDYMRPIADLVSRSPTTAVVFYDQLGNGRSTHLSHKEISFWTIDLFVNELENLLRHLGISDCFNLIGHSWGVPLACEFAIRRQPKGLRRAVLQNGWTYGAVRTAETAKVRKQLSQDIQDALRDGEAAGEYSTPEYIAANTVFFENFACRVKPWPDDFMRTLEYGVKNESVLKAMRDTSGPTGVADFWDIRDKIHLMRHVEALLITGEYDYITAHCSTPLFQGIDKVKWVHFMNCSHTPHIEDRERYMTVVGEYLAL